MRMVHEAQLHENNAFLTLTYDDKHLPKKGTLVKEDLQKFLKRLRHHNGPFKYYACGEYGDQTQRAHYHVCAFNVKFDDKIHFRRSGEHNLYISPTLNKIWGHGLSSIGNLTFETAAYTARYVMKKQFGKGGHRYVSLDEETGEITDLQQPFAIMSLRPAIAARWMHKYSADVYGGNKDKVVIRGKAMKPPKYYDKIYDEIDPHHMQYIKIERELNHEKLTEDEIRAREKLARARIIKKKQI